MNFLVLVSIMAGVLLGVFSNWFYDIIKQKQILPTNPSFKQFFGILLSCFVPLAILVALPQIVGNISIPQISFPQINIPQIAVQIQNVPQLWVLILSVILSMPIGFLWVEVYKNRANFRISNFVAGVLAQGIISGYNVLNRKAKTSDVIFVAVTTFIIIGLWYGIIIFILNTLGKFL